MKSLMGLLVLFTFVTAGCSNSAKQTEQAATQAAAQPSTMTTQENDVVHSQAVVFEKGSANLTDQAKAALTTLADSARRGGELARATLAVWPDQNFPATKKLTKADTNLAKERQRNIETYLKDTLKTGSIDTYVMTDRSNWLARTFNTKEAELKNMFSGTDKVPMKHEEFNMIKRDGGASKAVVLFHTDND